MTVITGAAGNGTTNDRAAIQAALNALATHGGTLQLEDNKQYRVSGGNLTIPRGVTLRGATPSVGLRGTNGGNTLNAAAGLLMEPSSTIEINSAGGLADLNILNPLISYPTANDLNYAGTAVRFLEDDITLQNVMIVGYEQAVASPAGSVPGPSGPNMGPARGHLDRVYIDCINGVYVQGAYDIWYLNEVHCWPFGTISSVTNGDTRRRGVAFNFTDVADWCKMTNCFSYGYIRGVMIHNCNSMTLIGCGFDNVPNDNPRDAIGILLDGYCGETRIIGCQVAASRRAITVNLDAGMTLISDTVTWANYYVGLETKGVTPISLVNCIIRDTPNRIATPNPSLITQVAVF